VIRNNGANVVGSIFSRISRLIKIKIMYVFYFDFLGFHLNLFSFKYLYWLDFFLFFFCFWWFGLVWIGMDDFMFIFKYYEVRYCCRLSLFVWKTL